MHVNVCGTGFFGLNGEYREEKKKEEALTLASIAQCCFVKTKYKYVLWVMPLGIGDEDARRSR